MVFYRQKLLGTGIFLTGNILISISLYCNFVFWKENHFFQGAQFLINQTLLVWIYYRNVHNILFDNSFIFAARSYFFTFFFICYQKLLKLLATFWSLFVDTISIDTDVIRIKTQFLYNSTVTPNNHLKKGWFSKINGINKKWRNEGPTGSLLQIPLPLVFTTVAVFEIISAKLTKFRKSQGSCSAQSSTH